MDNNIATRKRDLLDKYGPSLSHLKPFRHPKQDDVSRIDQSGCLSFITYGWIFSYLWSTYRGRIPGSDPRWACSTYDSTAVNTARLEYLWKEEISRATATFKPASLFRVAYAMTKTRIIVACSIFLLCLIFGFIGPACLVRSLIVYAETMHLRSDISYGLSIVFALTAIELIRVVTYGATWAVSFRTAVRLRNAVLGLLYKKLLTVRGLSNKGVGTIVNIFANDAQRLFEAVTFLPLVIMGPLVLIGGMIYLLFLIGPWSLVGFGVFFIVVVVQSGLGVTMKRFRTLAIARSNQRVKLITEMLEAIKFVKINAYEKPLIDRIYEVRKQEKRYLQSAGMAQSLAIAAGPVVPVIAAAFTFTGYMLSGHTLESSRAFSAVTVFFVMVFGIRSIPYGMRFVAEASVALKNIQSYYEMLDVQPFAVKSDMREDVLRIKSADFKFDKLETSSEEKEESEAILIDISLTLRRGNLFGLCGTVGCGKSSLLSAICGEIPLSKGVVEIGGTVAFVGQEPWICNDTLRENVLFGEAFDQNKFNKVVDTCCLSPDISAMPDGDMTEIGERGSTLSGGQKARLSLARALYSNKDLYLIDDIFSSLDIKVGMEVFKKGVKDFLREKAVILVSNNIQILNMCDEVAYMENGRIKDVADNETLLERCSAYKNFCSVIEKQQVSKISDVNFEATSNPNDMEDVTDSLIAPETRSYAVSKHSPQREERLIESEENLGLKSVPLSTYKTYVAAMGGFFVILIVLFAFALNVMFTIFSTVWLAEWLKDQRYEQLFNETDNATSLITHIELERQGSHVTNFAKIYLSSILLMILASVFKAVLFVKVSLNASNYLHNKTLNSVVHATMSWFESIPLGRVINRFSKDIDDLDVKIPFNAECFLQNCLQIVGYLVVIAWVFPWFLIACLPLSTVFLVFVACFRSGIRSLKRSENNSRSPLFSFVDSTIRGATTIRSFGKAKLCFDQFKLLLDVNSGCIFMYNCAMHWLAVWLDLIVVMITFCTSFLIVFLAGHVEPAYAGMVISFAMQMSGIFQFAVRTHTEFESHLTSVERLNHYRKKVDREQYSRSALSVAKNWPTEGKIEFKHVSLKYASRDALSLKDVSFQIEPKKKIGILGRTGSGKSSICSVLLKLYPVSEGTILIDGFDVKDLSVYDLRFNIAAIPQDPVLFSGTIRFNLDIRSEFSDDMLWEALKQANLKDTISGLDSGLDSEIVEGGKNFSLGQRQLLCIARALLRKSKIVILDEATAFLDDCTDLSVASNLMHAFADSTTLVVAHRINNVILTDQVLLMESGQVIESGSASALLNNKTSKFHDIVQLARAKSSNSKP